MARKCKQETAHAMLESAPKRAILLDGPELHATEAEQHKDNKFHYKIRTINPPDKIL